MHSVERATTPEPLMSEICKPDVCLGTDSSSSLLGLQPRHGGGDLADREIAFHMSFVIRSAKTRPLTWSSHLEPPPGPGCYVLCMTARNLASTQQ